ncbi:MAG: hypothetical protein M1819_006260 [Sarea resinae]|nr:MAG: hypothetical protein M1819_006260 [Sarea resinae]
MSTKPIFVATHPRACSTAFERVSQISKERARQDTDTAQVFMTCRDTLTCVHEPFGDAFYFGPERLSDRYENDEQARIDSGFSESTYKTILERIEREGSEGKRLFIKDITHYLVPPDSKPASIAPSLYPPKKGVGTANQASTTHKGTTATDRVLTPEDTTSASSNLTPATDTPTDAVPVATNKAEGYGASKSPPYPYPTPAEPNNPTVIPTEILKQFQFTFLIRHPRRSIPSYYRCTVPPLDEVTGFYNFMPSEAGYDELRRVFDYLRSIGQVGPEVAGRQQQLEESKAVTNGDTAGNHAGTNEQAIPITVVDADRLLDNPEGTIRAYCAAVGLPFSPSMLKWNTAADHQQARDAFEKWKGFHDDAINSEDLKPRAHKKTDPSPSSEDAAWTAKFGASGARVIRDTIDRNVADYEYLKSFALDV